MKRIIRQLGMIFVALLSMGPGTTAVEAETITETGGLDSLSEKPPICPRWAFEPWVWEDNGNTQESTLNLVAGYRQRNIPVGVVIVDSPWETAYHSYAWDLARYPEPGKMIEQLHDDNVRVVLWMTGAQNIQGKDTPVDQSPYFDEVFERGFAVNGGETFEWWKGTGMHIDFTNPKACDWFGGHITRLMDMGIDGWKVDQSAQYIPEPINTSIGVLSKAAFKPYYYAAFHDIALKHNPESLILARPYSHQGGYAASIDHCTVGWGGDYDGDWTGIKQQIQDLYRSAESGYGTLYVEVGGYFGNAANKESLIRYAQFGALMPVMSNGGSNGGLKEHLPWHWDDQTVEIYRYFAVLHSELAPYLFSGSVDAHLEGTSMVKAPDFDREQHLLGDQLFVSLVTSEEPVKQVVLPAEGAWIDYWNEEKLLAGGTAIEQPAPLDRIPIYIKAGAVIPLNVRNSVTAHGDESAAGKDTILVYPYGKTTYQYHRATGAGIEYRDVLIGIDEQAGTLVVKGTDIVQYRFRIRCQTKPSNVSGADSWHYDKAARCLVVDKRGSSFTLEIADFNQ